LAMTMGSWPWYSAAIVMCCVGWFLLGEEESCFVDVGRKKLLGIERSMWGEEERREYQHLQTEKYINRW
jgi:hypothetical protein